MNFWEEKYRQNETGWERGHINPAFHHWEAFSHLDPGAVLIPGCGRSPEVRAFAENGWQVTAVDIARAAIDYQKVACQDLVSNITFIETDLLTWIPPEPFDLIYEQTCLCALDPSLWVQYEECLARWLKPNGLLAALFMQTHRPDGPPFHCDINAMVELFHNGHWVWPDHQPVVSAHPKGIHELGICLTRTST